MNMKIHAAYVSCGNHINFLICNIYYPIRNFLYNAITSLPAGAFAGLTALTFLYFFICSFYFIPRQSLIKFIGYNFLNLYLSPSNKLLAFMLTLHSVSTKPLHTYFRNFDSNYISIVTAGAFSGLTSLNTL